MFMVYGDTNLLVGVNVRVSHVMNWRIVQGGAGYKLQKMDG